MNARGNKHSGRIEPVRGKQYLADLRWNWQAIYARACKHDGIMPGARCAVFSNDNPFVPFLDRAASEFFQAVREYQAGGYIGLRLQ